MGDGGKRPTQAAIVATGPKTVLQVFHNVVSFGKAENNAAAREELCRWQNPFLSLIDDVAGGTLHLPQGVFKDLPRFERSDLLILNNYNDSSTVGARLPLHEEVEDSGVTLLQLGSRVVDYEIFQLRRGSAGLELHLAYTRHATSIGSPHRNDYRIARLETGRPVRVTINGKLDFSASGRRARSYQVRDYLFLYLGDFTLFKPCPATSPGTLKRLPLAEARHVDLREILY